MAVNRCPQCGTEVKDATAAFCPNPDCGFPLAFAKEPEPEEAEPAMERRPLEKDVRPPDPKPTVVVPVTPPPTPVIPPPTPPTPPAEKKSGPNPAVLIAAALGVVLLIGIVVAFAGGGGDDDEEPAQERNGGAVEETAEPDATAEPEPPAEAAVFSRIPPDETAFGGDGDQMMHRVVAGDGKLIAVGRSGFKGEYDAALWTSADGETWQRVGADPADVGGEGEQEMTAIAKAPEGYVIVGYDRRPGASSDAAVWLFDGAVVERVDPTQSELGGLGIQEMSRVVASDGGIVAVGTDGHDTEDREAGVWGSIDGRSWARIHSDNLGGDGHQFMRSITPFREGFVGAGDEETDEGFDAAVWMSPAGESFDRILGTADTFGGEGDQAIFTVLTVRDHLVAVGSAAIAGNIDAAVWLSEDGLAWQRIDDPTFGGPRRQTMFGAIAAKEVLVAVGFDGAAGEDDDAAAWYTSDGTAWTKATVDAGGGPGEQRMKGIAVFKGRVIAVGWDGSGGDLDAAVWSAPLP